MDYVIYADEVILSDPVRKSGNGDSHKKGHPGFTPQPGAAPSVSRRFQILLAVLCVTLICSLCVLGTIGVLYASKSNQFESLKTQHSNLSERLTEHLKACKRCAEGWVFNEKKCYFFSTDLMKWTQSRDRCVSMGGHLVIITSQEEQTFLDSHTEGMTHWIGLNDMKTEGRWLWVDNTPLSQTGVEFWFKRSDGKSEPDNWSEQDSSGEDCAALGNGYIGTHVWLDASCEICSTHLGVAYNKFAMDNGLAPQRNIDSAIVIMDF
ncbi:hypothetical protein UPYG_G00331960 [Umbra pygmaea]|uniref:C-type lectin domain-containing protein n=1 Tax=Umbra pygmaea TaxID=75934 RepID=A0ABD0VZQ6_UMBPY